MPPKSKAKQVDEGSTSEEQPPGDFYIANNCSPTSFYNTFKGTIWKFMPQEYRDLLETWPFKHFLTDRKIRMSRDFLTHLFSKWDSDNEGFDFNGHILYPTVDEFAVILGVKARGQRVPDKKNKTRWQDIHSPLCRKFFPGVNQVYRKDIVRVLLEQLSAKKTATPKEWLALFTMWFFSMVLFPTIDNRIPMHLWETVENIDDIYKYGWARAVHRFITCEFKDKAREVFHHLTTAEGGRPSLSGCTMALHVWVYEHTQPELCVDGDRCLPRFLNWNLEYNREDDFQKIYKSMKADNLQVGELIPLIEEAWIFASNHEVAKYGYLHPEDSASQTNLGISIILNKTFHALLKFTNPSLLASARSAKRKVEHLQAEAPNNGKSPRMTEKGAVDSEGLNQPSNLDFERALEANAAGSENKNGADHHHKQASGTGPENNNEVDKHEQDDAKQTQTKKHLYVVSTKGLLRLRKGRMYKFSKIYPQNERVKLYNICCKYTPRVPKPCRTTLPRVSFSHPGRSPLAPKHCTDDIRLSCVTQAIDEPAFDKTPVQEDLAVIRAAQILLQSSNGTLRCDTNSADEGTELLQSYLLGEPTFELCLKEPDAVKDRGRWSSIFDAAEIVIPGQDFDDSCCEGWDDPNKVHDYPFRTECTRNMQKVLQAFINGALCPNENQDLHLFHSRISMAKLYNVLTGGILTAEVVDSMAMLVSMNQHEKQQAWFYIDCQSVHDVPSLDKDKLKDDKYNWTRDSTLSNIKYLFLPFRQHTQWVLVVFNLVDGAVNIWNTALAPDELHNAVNGIVANWKAWLSDNTAHKGAIGWRLFWRHDIKQVGMHDSGLLIVKIMEGIADGQPISFDPNIISQSRAAVVYNILASQYSQDSATQLLQ